MLMTEVIKHHLKQDIIFTLPPKSHTLSGGIFMADTQDYGQYRSFHLDYLNNLFAISCLFSTTVTTSKPLNQKNRVKLS